MANDVITLPKLTPKQHAYVMLRVQGTGQSDAYKQVYNVSNPDSPNIRWMAYEQEQKPKIKQWLDTIRDTMGLTLCTKEAHLHRLHHLGKEAQGKGQLGAAIHAEELRGKATGHYNHTKRVQTAHVDLAELMKAIDGNTRGIQTIEGECEEVN